LFLLSLVAAFVETNIPLSDPFFNINSSTQYVCPVKENKKIPASWDKIYPKKRARFLHTAVWMFRQHEE